MYVTALIYGLGVVLLWSSATAAATLRLNWQDTSSNEAGFKIERRSGGNYVEIATVGADVQSYNDTTAAPGTNYCYRIRAFNSSGSSTTTNVACAMAPTGAKPSPGTPSPNDPKPNPDNPEPITPPVPASPSLAWKDYQLTMNIRGGDDPVLGVMFRYQDANNYYRFSWLAGGKTQRLEKKVDGQFHVLAEQAASYRPWQRYPLQITSRGSALTVAVGGKTIFSATDSSFSRGTIALFSSRGSRSYFDDIDVRELDSGNILLADDFNDGDHVGWTLIDDSAASPPSQWSVRNGALVQTAATGDNDLGTYALYTGGSWTDYKMTFKMRSTDDDRIGALFRFKDSNNHYRFVWEKDQPGRTLLKQVNGTYTVLAQDTVPYNTNQTYNVEIIAQGDSLKINIDGKPVFAVTDSSFNSGTVALFSSRNQGSYFDDVLVEDLISKTVLLDEDFSNRKLTGWKRFDESGVSYGPSKWRVINGAVAQTRNIGADTTGFPGTYLLH